MLRGIPLTAALLMLRVSHHHGLSVEVMLPRFYLLLHSAFSVVVITPVTRLRKARPRARTYGGGKDAASYGIKFVDASIGSPRKGGHYVNPKAATPKAKHKP